MGQMIELKQGDKLPADAYCILEFSEMSYDSGWNDGCRNTLCYSTLYYTLDRQHWADEIGRRSLSPSRLDKPFIPFQAKVPTINLSFTIN